MGFPEISPTLGNAILRDFIDFIDQKADRHIITAPLLSLRNVVLETNLID